MTSTADLIGRHAEVAASGNLLLREQRLPAPGPGEVRVRMEFCGLCSSDLGYIANPTAEPGRRLGHEGVGVVEHGAGLVRPGRYVVQTSEGFSEQLVVRPEHLVPVPDSLDPALGALAEPVACSLLAVERSVRQTPPREALVVGAGFMGLVIVHLLTARGIPVTVADPDPEARREATRLGAMVAVDPRDLQGEANFELVLECVGSQAALDLAARHVSIAGLLSVVGYHQSDGGRRSVDLRTLNYRGVDVINAHERDEATKRDAMSRALVVMSMGVLDADALVTAIIPLGELPALVAGGTVRGKHIVRCAR